MIKIYRIIGNELLIPEHYLINPLYGNEEDSKYEIPINYDKQLEVKMLGNINFKRWIVGYLETVLQSEMVGVKKMILLNGVVGNTPYENFKF